MSTVEPLTPQPLPDWYESWRTRVYQWIGDRTRPEVADLVLLMPDLLALVVRLIFDSRTPLFFKAQLVLVAAYTVIPIDFIPEAVLGAAGLADDAVVISIMLLKLLQSASGLDAKLIQELWSGKGNLVETLNLLSTNDEKFIHPRLWQVARTLLGLQNPDPAVIDKPT